MKIKMEKGKNSNMGWFKSIYSFYFNYIIIALFATRFNVERSLKTIDPHKSTQHFFLALSHSGQFHGQSNRLWK